MPTLHAAFLFLPSRWDRYVSFSFYELAPPAAVDTVTQSGRIFPGRLLAESRLSPAPTIVEIGGAHLAVPVVWEHPRDAKNFRPTALRHQGL